MTKNDIPKDRRERSEAELDRRLRDYWQALGEGEVPPAMTELAGDLERARREGEAAGSDRVALSSGRSSDGQAAAEAAAAPLFGRRRAH